MIRNFILIFIILYFELISHIAPVFYGKRSQPVAYRTFEGGGNMTIEFDQRRAGWDQNKALKLVVTVPRTQRLLIAFSKSFSENGSDFYEFNGKTRTVTDWHAQNISPVGDNNQNFNKV